MSNEFLVSALSPISTELRTSLVEAIASVRTTLQGISQNRDRFYSVFGQAFGNSFKATVAETIRSQWSSGDFSQSPIIQILDSGLNGALGAYAISNNRIYLDASLLAGNQSQTLASVLLEEIGHSVDAQINSVDTVGDEGQLFSALARGETLTDAQVAAIRGENDAGFITVNGESISVERAIFIVTNTNDSGAGSLRAAIDAANSNSGTDTITFNIATSDLGYNASTGAYTINLLSVLPQISDAVILDGTSQTGFTDHPIIELNGTSAGNVHGLRISAGNSTVKGLAINRFGQSGIYFSTNGNNTVTGNYIGTDVTGTVDFGNTAFGLWIDSSSNNNTIGGTTATTRNLISGNHYGMYVSGSQNQVSGNYIGTNASATASLGNSSYGVIILGANNIVGGSTLGARNIISGNGDGVYLQGTNATGNQILGNYIGTDVTGTLALGNVYSGIGLNDAPNNIIGGSTVAERNVISANRWGVLIGNPSSTNNQILGNYIGTNAAGTVALGNNQGVTINAPNNSISSNVIAGNTDIGVRIFGITSTGNKVQKNWIGTTDNGISGLGNGYAGLYIESSASNNLIGGIVASEGNIIAFNAGSGIQTYRAGTGNGFLSNQIFSNEAFYYTSLGIDLKGDGLTSNDLGDADTGDNNLQNFPAITAKTSGGTTTLTATLNSIAYSTFTIQFFSNAAADPSGYGEGQTFLGNATLQTDNTGNGTVSFAIPNSNAPLNSIITATATDSSNNTSEFSQAVTVIEGSSNSAPTDLSLSVNTINENVVANTVIGNFSSTDPDTGNTFTYSLVSGTGSDDNAAFTINGSQLQINASPDFETKSTYNIRLRTTDQGGLSFEKALTININNVNEAPTVTSGASINFAEKGIGTVYTATANDPDAGTILAYSISGTDSALFNINSSTGGVTFKTSPNFDTPTDNGANNVYDINVIASDGSLTATKAVAITVTKVTATQRVSVATGGTQTNNGSSAPSISSDGRYVACLLYTSPSPRD